MAGGLNNQISKHARTSLDWKHREKADRAYTLFDVINEQLFKYNLPDIIVGFDTRLKKSGEYYFEADNIGLKHHFDIHPDIKGLDLILATLHNATHADIDIQKGAGKWYHNKAFQDSMKQWGVEVDKNGDAIALDPDVFSEVLRRIGEGQFIGEILQYDPSYQPDLSLNSTEQLPESSSITVNIPKVSKPKVNKQKKWSCSCLTPTNLRCYTNLTAYCTTCNSDFELQG